MIPLHILVNKETYDWIRRIAKEEDRSAASIIRAAMKDYVAGWRYDRERDRKSEDAA